MRKIAAAALAVPVIALLYVPLLVRRSVVARVTLAIGVGAIVGLGAIGISRPAGTAATPPSQPVPVTLAAVRTDLRVGQGPRATIQIAFSTPMDETSVAAAIRVEPGTAVDLTWNAERTLLTVVPRGAWALGTYHTITVEPGALAATGRPLSTLVRAAFLTRAATSATIEATRAAGTRLRLDSAFILTFDRRVDPRTLREALRIEPAIAGTFERLGRRSSGERFLFTPSNPLTPGVQYQLSLSAAVRDADGAPLAALPSLTAQAARSPKVVRFRPRDRTEAVDRQSMLSVRFTESMDPASTKAAFTVTSGGKPIVGTIRFAERNTVLVFDPKEPFGYGQWIQMTVSTGASSAAGVPLATKSTGVFKTYIRPVRRAATATTSTSTSIPRTGSVGTGSWTAVESYYLRLMNCTRTGGWVTSTGSCSSPGGRNVAPLMLDSGISSRVSRPYARLLATRGLCSHFVGGNPGDRLRAAGYTSYIWAENLGCRSGDPYSAVLGSHLFFQSEKSYSGGHYVNLMNSKYDRVGIGVWVYAGRVRLVVDFYHPR